MQTILGSTGIIGTELAKALTAYTGQIRLVSRNPQKVNAADHLLAADLTDAGQTDAAVAGSEVAYLTAGLPYDLKVWRAQWPLVMQNVLNACKKHGTKLVFFDNVYLYGKAPGPMTEETPVNPVSEKGKVRAQIAQMLMHEVEKGHLDALIARSADFYGPHTATSFVTALVFEKYAKGKSAQWMLNDRVRHSFTYTPDAGKATAILGNTASAYNQAWHLPTDGQALTGKEFMTAAAAAFGVEPRYSVLPRWMLRLVGLFTPVVRENMEMLYQNDADYLFDSGKFSRAVRFPTTSYTAGIAETAKSFREG